MKRTTVHVLCTAYSIPALFQNTYNEMKLLKFKIDKSKSIEVIFFFDWNLLEHISHNKRCVRIINTMNILYL